MRTEIDEGPSGAAPATEPAAALARPRRHFAHLADVDDGTLLALRRRKVLPRLLSVLAMAVAAIAILRGMDPVPAWGLLLLYVVPVGVIVGMDAAGRALWRRRARAYGLSPPAMAELFRCLRRAPARIPTPSADELLLVVRALTPRTP